MMMQLSVGLVRRVVLRASGAIQWQGKPVNRRKRHRGEMLDRSLLAGSSRSVELRVLSAQKRKSFVQGPYDVKLLSGFKTDELEHTRHGKQVIGWRHHCTERRVCKVWRVRRQFPDHLRSDVKSHNLSKIQNSSQ